MNGAVLPNTDMQRLTIEKALSEIKIHDKPIENGTFSRASRETEKVADGGIEIITERNESVWVRIQQEWMGVVRTIENGTFS